MAYVDGNSTKRHNENEMAYLEWRVMSEDGLLLCAFYGPMSCIAAGTVCEAINSGKTLMSPSDVMKCMKIE